MITQKSLLHHHHNHIILPSEFINQSNAIVPPSEVRNISLEMEKHLLGLIRGNWLTIFATQYITT